MTNTVLLIEKTENTAILTLNRPKVMNSLNFDMLNALKDAVSDIRFERKIRAVIITGAGEKAFCAGADLKERATMPPESVKKYIFTLRDLFTDIEQLPQPVIAAVNGAAFGGGAELALASDIRIASETAVMGLTETRLGIIPGGGGTQRLPRLIGRARAKEMIFTGMRVGAKEALSLGLVNRISEPEKLTDDAKKMAQDIAKSAPVAVTQAKYAINRGIETDLSTGLAIESNAYWVTIPTEDRLEGLAAFKEKRKPLFKGK